MDYDWVKSMQEEDDIIRADLRVPRVYLLTSGNRFKNDVRLLAKPEAISPEVWHELRYEAAQDYNAALLAQRARRDSVVAKEA